MANPWWRRAERFVRARLTWSRVYRATSYVRSALWIVPFLAIVIVLAAVPVIRWIDARLAWRVTDLGVEGARALFETVITLALSFMVFTFGSLLVAIQIAGGQLTPRIIATTLLRDNVVRYSVGLFVVALVFAIMARDRLEDQVHHIVAFIVGCLGVGSMATFLFLIDYAARLLRPVSILARVGNEGQAVIASVYPQAAIEADAPDELPDLSRLPRRVVAHTGGSSILLAIDHDTLTREASWANGVIEILPRVGDFVAEDDPLFVLYGGAVEIDGRLLQTTVAFGSERTMEQDPLFAFRILVDIALKALSPAINDPTTAVLAIDQIHRLLRMVGQRRLRGSSILDRQGHTRVILRTPDWEDFVHLAAIEIRAFGAGSVQVARRLRAMFEQLAATLPAHRREAIDEEGKRLDRAVALLYPEPDDRALALAPDSQGLGGGFRGDRNGWR